MNADGSKAVLFHETQTRMFGRNNYSNAAVNFPLLRI